MLQYKTIEPASLELLKRLMLVNPFKSFRLAGGTSLALQLGHRNSIDIDLFGDLQVDEAELDSFLSDLGAIELIKKTANIYGKRLRGKLFQVFNNTLIISLFDRYPDFKAVISDQSEFLEKLNSFTLSPPNPPFDRLLALRRF